MLDREACERRVYRLAALLTGSRRAAADVLDRVLTAQSDLRRLDSIHLDRLTVLCAREVAPAAIVEETVPPQAALHLASLPPQQREAWIFAHVYRMPERPMARAMDCSVTAARRHLEQAAAAMAGDGATEPQIVAGALLQHTLALDVPASHRIARRRRRRIRLAVKLTVVLLILAGLAIAARLVLS